MQGEGAGALDCLHMLGPVRQLGVGCCYLLFPCGLSCLWEGGVTEKRLKLGKVSSLSIEGLLIWELGSHISKVGAKKL